MSRPNMRFTLTGDQTVWTRQGLCWPSYTSFSVWKEAVCQGDLIAVSSTKYAGRPAFLDVSKPLLGVIFFFSIKDGQ